jgi:hypothetical protein
MPSAVTPGSFVRIKLTSNFSFQDDTATSNLTGNTFGTDTGVAWNNPLGMYVYLVLNDNEDDVTPMLARMPHFISSPASGNIGTPAAANCNSDTSMWCFESITTTEWDSNPAICIGAFRAIKNDAANDDWTVQSLSNHDGVGRFLERYRFTLPTGQNGAASGTYVFTNAGTEPVFSDQIMYYYVSKSGLLTFQFIGSNVTTAGVGTNVMSIVLPLNKDSTASLIGVAANKRDNSTNTRDQLIPYMAATTRNMFFFPYTSAEALVTNATFALNDRLEFGGTYQLSAST